MSPVLRASALVASRNRGRLLALTALAVCVGCSATTTPGPTTPAPGAEDFKLTGHYYKDKYYFFPYGRDYEREALFGRALLEGAQLDQPEPDRRLNAEQNLAVDYDSASYLANIFGKNEWQYGIVLGKVGRWKEAVAAFQSAVKENPSDLGAWGNLGVANHALGRYHESVEAFGEALQRDPAYFSQRPTQRLVWQASRESQPVPP